MASCTVADGFSASTGAAFGSMVGPVEDSALPGPEAFSGIGAPWSAGATSATAASVIVAPSEGMLGVQSGLSPLEAFANGLAIGLWRYIRLLLLCPELDIAALAGHSAEAAL